ncbi:MAG: hypothetical protein ACPGJV_07535 [Bacteriovoracaceae bacterium]
MKKLLLKPKEKDLQLTLKDFENPELIEEIEILSKKTQTINIHNWSSPLKRIKVQSPLSEFPQLENIEELELLKITGSSISKIPKLNKLNCKKLYLQRNKLSRFSFQSLDIQILEELDLSNNQISEFEINTFELGLKRLNLENNNLASLPKETFQLKNLLSIGLKGNPFSEEEKLEIKKCFNIDLFNG